LTLVLSEQERLHSLKIIPQSLVEQELQVIQETQEQLAQLETLEQQEIQALLVIQEQQVIQALLVIQEIQAQLVIVVLVAAEETEQTLRQEIQEPVDRLETQVELVV
jgi:hypothetical protein